MALRKAFNVNGVYAPEEMDKEIAPVVESKPLEIQGGDKPADEGQLTTLKAYGFVPEQPMTKQEAAEKIREFVTKK